jgi:Cu/Zn superoxide dismutase
MNHLHYLVLLATLSFVLSSRYLMSENDMPLHRPAASVTKAIVVLSPTKGNRAGGIIKFTKTARRIQVKGSITGLQPNTIHAMHVHEYGGNFSRSN